VALPSEQALVDATSVVFKILEWQGIRCGSPTANCIASTSNHPDTNGMIDYFVRPLGGVRGAIGWRTVDEFAKVAGMQFRARPAGVVEGPITTGTLDLISPCQRARSLTRATLKFTLTGPHMLARTLLYRHYKDFGRPCDGARPGAGRAGRPS